MVVAELALVVLEAVRLFRLVIDLAVHLVLPELVLKLSYQALVVRIEVPSHPRSLPLLHLLFLVVVLQVVQP